jgi:hypothetical protein
MHRHLEILSGGQTGVDRGALDAALELGNPCGGWCPAGRRAEDGPIPERYPLTELKGAGYPERTRKNVEDSDAALILHRGPLSAGTLLTLRICEELRKPVSLIDAAEVSLEEGARTARAFIDSHDVQRLNVAGPRASHWPHAHAYARDLIRALLKSTGH